MRLRPSLKTLDEAVRAMERIIQREKYGTNERAADERRLREIKAVRDEVLLAWCANNPDHVLSQHEQL